MIQKWISIGVLLALVSIISTSLFAKKAMIYSGGYTQFEESYDTGFNTFVGYQLISEDGFGFGFQSGYIRGEASDGDSSINIFPAKGEAGYYWRTDKKLSPYLEVNAGVNFMLEREESTTSSTLLGGSDSSNSVNQRFFFGYGGSSGLMWNVADDFSVFIEANKQFHLDSERDTELNPFSVVAGVLVWGDWL